MTILREENCHSVLVVNLQIDNSHASKEKSRKNLPHKTEKYMFYQNWQWRMDYQKISNLRFLKTMTLNQTFPALQQSHLRFLKIFHIIF